MKYLLAFFLLLQATGLLAQNQPNKASADSLRDITKQFLKAYSELSAKRDPETILSFMAKDLSSLLVNANIGSNTQTLKSNYKGLQFYLKKLISAADNKLQLKYDLKEIVKAETNGNLGLVVYLAGYAILKEQQEWSEGQEVVTLVFQRLNNEWKIIHYTTTTLENEKHVGECYCEFYEDIKTNTYETVTTIPAGKNYYQNKHKIEFLKTPEGRRVKLNNEQVYRWELNSEIWDNTPLPPPATPKEGAANTPEPPKALGKAKTQQDVIDLIMKSLYPNCESVVSKKIAANKK